MIQKNAFTVMLIIGVFNILLHPVAPVFALDCEIISSTAYTRSQEVIATDWNAGIPYRELKTEIYPCAWITIRNIDWLKKSSQHIAITAVFSDKSRATKDFACEARILNPQDEYSCSVCFENQSSIAELACEFK